MAKAVIQVWRRSPLTVTAAVLCAAAVIFAGGAGWSWYRAAQAGPSAYSQARDAALAAGEQAVQNFSTLDYRNVNRGLDLWEQSSTGALRGQIAAGRAQFAKEISEQRTVTTARILDAALTALNTRAGTASILAAVQLTVTPASGSPVTKENRVTGDLTRTATGWKLSGLGQAPVGPATGAGS